jgi:hypothetical protein
LIRSNVIFDFPAYLCILFTVFLRLVLLYARLYGLCWFLNTTFIANTPVFPGQIQNVLTVIPTATFHLFQTIVATKALKSHQIGAGNITKL